MHIGDIVPYNSMTQIGYNDLFTAAPSAQPLPLITAWLGSAAWPTFSPGPANTAGTILGPNGATVPNFGLSGGTVGSAVAANMQQANDVGLPVGPVSFVTALPSIIPPNKSATVAAPPDALCKLGNWAAKNPGTAALGCIAVFLILRGAKR